MHRSIAGSFKESASVKKSEERPAQRDTIAAISTPAGEGAIALVRISGEDAIEVANRVYRGKEKPSSFPPQTQRLGEIFEADRLIDQIMLSVHRGPASYTGEDLVEITCHGGILVTTRVLEACFHAGARSARPDEFSERAFLNGKMDLTQAEAVMDLIRAQSDLALRSANEQLEGRLGSEIKAIRAQLIEMLAHVEAAIDFPEEDIAPDEGGKLGARLASVQDKMHDLLATAEQGRILREGVRTVIYGPTNAGKSSLLNRLLGYDRAIVSEKPGTTRDTIEEVIRLRGVPLRLTDTAGLRESTDELERAGITRTGKALETADLLLHILDRSAPKPAGFDESSREQIEVVLLNKSDLPEHSDWKHFDALRICCVEENGLQGVEEAILARISANHLRPENSLAINMRHHDCLRRALDSCELARATIKAGIGPEYMAVDLRAALRAVGEITGAEGAEEILDSLFAQFCIGK
jgi:tRNA modification GTPase